MNDFNLRSVTLNNINVTLDKEDQRQIALSFLKEKYAIDEDYYIDGEDNLVRRVKHNGFRFMAEDEIVRKATEKDKVILEILQDLS